MAACTCRDGVHVASLTVEVLGGLLRWAPPADLLLRRASPGLRPMSSRAGIHVAFRTCRSLEHRRPVRKAVLMMLSSEFAAATHFRSALPFACALSHSSYSARAASDRA